MIRNEPRHSCCYVARAPTTQGKYEDAERFLRHAMEMTEATLGKDHWAYSIDLGNLAGLLVAQVRAGVCRCTFGAYLAGSSTVPHNIWGVTWIASATGVTLSSAMSSSLRME